MKKTKKILALVLASLMFITILPISTFAAQSDELWVAATRIKLDKESFWLNDGKGGITAEGASESNYNVKVIPAIPSTKENNFKGENAKITFKNASLSKWYTQLGYQTVLACVYYYSDYNRTKADLILEGNNTIELKENSEYGIVGFNAICGDGKLNIKGVSSNPNAQFYGIGNPNGSIGAITVCDNATLNISIPNGTAIGGLTAKDNATVKVDAGNGNGITNSTTIHDNASVKVNARWGIGSSLTITGGTLEVIAQNTATTAKRINFNVNEYNYQASYKYPVVKVNKEARAFGSWRWTEKNELNTFKYLKVAPPSHFEYFVKESAAEVLDYFSQNMLLPFIEWIISLIL